MEALATEVCSSAFLGQKGCHRMTEAWQAILGWLDFLFQALIQILRVTPSWALSFSFFPSINFSALPADEVPAGTFAKAEAHSEAPLDKLTVVLDLDETLICSYETSSLPAAVHSQAIEAGLKCFELKCITVDKEAEGRQEVNHITFYERPGVKEFLEEICKFADLILFTAGLEGYARPIVDIIDAENKFSLCLYRSETVRTEFREHVKDLSCLSKDLCRVVIVDNNPFSFLLQPLNGIPCVPFSAGQPNDEQLIQVLLPLLKLLSLQKDVRPVLYDMFRMPEWFQKHGIPSLEIEL